MSNRYKPYTQEEEDLIANRLVGQYLSFKDLSVRLNRSVVSLTTKSSKLMREKLELKRDRK